MTDPRTKAVWLTPEAKAQLEALRVRSGHAEGHDGSGHSAVVEWLIRAMTEHYARIDRENAADMKPKKRAAAREENES